MIIGIGIDIVDINRINNLLNKFGNKFVNRILCPEEILEYTVKAYKKKHIYLASRFAAKEAIAKAFRTGIGKLAFKDITIMKAPNGAVKGYLTKEKLFTIGIEQDIDILLSLSDEKNYAVAFSIINIKN